MYNNICLLFKISQQCAFVCNKMSLEYCFFTEVWALESTSQPSLVQLRVHLTFSVSMNIKTLHTLFSMVAQNKKIASIDQKCHIAPFLVFVCFLLFSFAVSFKPDLSLNL